MIIVKLTLKLVTRWIFFLTLLLPEWMIKASLVAITFESVDEILQCDHSNERYWAVLSCDTVYYAVQGGSNFWVCG